MMKESTVIKESKANVSTVVEGELLDHGDDLQGNVTENGKVNVVGNDVSNSLQNGVIENEKIPADDNDAVVDNDFDVSDDSKGITNRKRKLSTDSDNNIMKVPLRSVIFVTSLICPVKPALQRPLLLCLLGLWGWRPSLAFLLMFQLLLSPLTPLSLRIVSGRISLPSGFFCFLSLCMVRSLTVNVRSLREANKRSSFLQWLSQSTVDFVCLQETHVPSNAECTS